MADSKQIQLLAKIFVSESRNFQGVRNSYATADLYQMGVELAHRALQKCDGRPIIPFFVVCSRNHVVNLSKLSRNKKKTDESFESVQTLDRKSTSKRGEAFLNARSLFAAIDKLCGGKLVKTQVLKVRMDRTGDKHLAMEEACVKMQGFESEKVASAIEMIKQFSKLEGVE